MEILSKTKRNLWLVAGICFWILGAIVFGKYDLEISQLLYHPDWKWAVAFENGGRLTTPILLAVWSPFFDLFGKSGSIQRKFTGLSMLGLWRLWWY